MKWIKTLEKFKDDYFTKQETEEESEQDLVVLSSEEEIEKEKSETSDSYVDDEGIVHIEDWDQY
jgi:hypothetical protein